MPDLIEPHVRVRASFLASVPEFLAEGRGGHNTMLGDWRAKFEDRWHTDDGFDEFVSHLHADATPDAPRPDHHVPQSTWWLVEGDDYLGRISCRHSLNEWLAEYGGHVGYEVRPSARRQGHATTMLRAVRPRVHALGIDPALLTCDDTNVASRRVIEAAGGVFEDQRLNKLRFWLPTASAAHDLSAAASAYARAAGRATSEPERDHLTRRAAELRSRGDQQPQV